ncbi:hypothetical protein [Sphaerisporangium perillae]|uniref:hypothetical protein n=1 Tax=Sphaerisporangium perillae TaxID=2935860 RepID=UPI0020101EDB|nr:hypothetical protein [Sphaerisporangium perillae]
MRTSWHGGSQQLRLDESGKQDGDAADLADDPCGHEGSRAADGMAILMAELRIEAPPSVVQTSIS